MSRPEDLNPVTAEDMLEQPDFADEHKRPTFADEQANDPGMEPDETMPRDHGGHDPSTSRPD